MFYKVLIEEGLYREKTTKEVRNLLYGIEIYTPLGLVTIENPQDYLFFETIEAALLFYNLELIEQDI